MRAPTYLKLGVGLSLFGLVLHLGGGALAAGLFVLLGLLCLVLALYALAAQGPMPPLVLGGVALFTGGRLLPLFLGPGPHGLWLAVLSNLGTVVLFYGVYQVVQARVGGAPARSAKAKGGAPRRRTSIRPPQAPLLPSPPREDGYTASPTQP